jgi:hypothetical protein
MKLFFLVTDAPDKTKKLDFYIFGKCFKPSEISFEKGLHPTQVEKSSTRWLDLYPNYYISFKAEKGCQGKHFGINDKEKVFMTLDT